MVHLARQIRSNQRLDRFLDHQRGRQWADAIANLAPLERLRKRKLATG
jgi:hypothetical protein